MCRRGSRIRRACLTPFRCLYEAAAGSRKFDVDGHEYVDYWLGHGANLLGHAHPEVVTAVEEQLGEGLPCGRRDRDRLALGRDDLSASTVGRSGAVYGMRG